MKDMKDMKKERHERCRGRIGKGAGLLIQCTLCVWVRSPSTSISNFFFLIVVVVHDSVFAMSSISNT